jgi:hypothetical protein
MRKVYVKSKTYMLLKLANDFDGSFPMIINNELYSEYRAIFREWSDIQRRIEKSFFKGQKITKTKGAK